MLFIEQEVIMNCVEFLNLKMRLKCHFKFKNVFQNFRNYHKLLWTKGTGVKITASFKIINRRYDTIHIYLQLL